MEVILIQKYGIAEFNFRLYSRQEPDLQFAHIQYQIKQHVYDISIPFMPGCLNYFNQECMSCQQGWNLDRIVQLCQPICGNEKIDGYEECEDGNDEPYDGCFECKYQCMQDCLYCQFGICEQCAFRFTFDETRQQCLPICGDGKLVPYNSEYCNDGNYECDMFCSLCINFSCSECKQGFQLQNNGICNPLCGDKIVLPDFEECDDGNDKNDDECHECKLVCEQGCEICEQGRCKLNCKQTYGIGFYYINQQCISICGDSINAVDEECDDGNDKEFDGCFNCKYSCEKNCLDCQFGQCFKYQSICGDAKLQGEEECDDGNQDSNDGCFNCFVEPGWKCNQIEQNCFCNLNHPAQFISKFLSIQNNKQLVIFQFSQEIKIMSGYNLTESMILQILNISDNQYILTITEKKEPLDQIVQEVYYVIQIEINTILDFKPILSIDLNATILIVNQLFKQLQYYIKSKFNNQSFLQQQQQ